MTTGSLFIKIPTLPAGWMSRWTVRAGGVSGAPGQPLAMVPGPTRVSLDAEVWADRWWFRATTAFEVDVAAQGQTTVRVPVLPSALCGRLVRR